MDPVVFLFDLDGVLVQPGGYRAAVRATVNYFTGLLGLGPIAPDDETIAIFEAQGITSEWDMVPLLLAITLEQLASRDRSVDLESFESACRSFDNGSEGSQEINFAPAMRRLGRYVEPGRTPSEAIYDARTEVFPRLAGQGVLAELLTHTRWLEKSRTSAVFETFALGSAVYSRFTGLPVEVQAESTLERYDRPLLDAATRDRLVALRSQGRLCFSAYTARPSAPTGKVDELLSVYAPEAEMALAQLGIDPFPLVGSGQTGEVARRLGEQEERLIKPAPYHAIAAIASAWTGDRAAALDWMAQVFCFLEKHASCPVTEQPTLQTAAGRMPAALQLHIFEDSPAGMRGGLHAGELLAKLGMAVELRLWGVSDHPEKMAALQAVGAQVYPDVNQAVDQALRTIPAA